jgi:outer membrane protein OmpA-like peptidoglycan-associated protein
MGLSQRRATTVAEALVKAGIPSQIITTKAWGETDLAVQTPPDTPLQANRRVVVDYTQ